MTYKVDGEEVISENVRNRISNFFDQLHKFFDKEKTMIKLLHFYYYIKFLHLYLIIHSWVFYFFY